MAIKVKGPQFAYNHQHWTGEHWVKVIFTHESPFNCLWFEKGITGDQLDNVLIRDASKS